MHSTPFSNPTPNRVYIKFLKFVAENPGCTWREIQAAIHPGKPLYTSQTLFQMLKEQHCVDVSKVGNTQHFTVAPSGCRLLGCTIKDDYPWAYDLVNMAIETKSKSLSEFDINLAVYGMHSLIEAETLKKLLDLQTDKHALAVVSAAIPFYKDLKAKAESLVGSKSR